MYSCIAMYVLYILIHTHIHSSRGPDNGELLLAREVSRRGNRLREHALPYALMRP